MHKIRIYFPANLVHSVKTSNSDPKIGSQLFDKIWHDFKNSTEIDKNLDDFQNSAEKDYRQCGEKFLKGK